METEWRDLALGDDALDDVSTWQAHRASRRSCARLYNWAYALTAFTCASALCLGIGVGVLVERRHKTQGSHDIKGTKFALRAVVVTFWEAGGEMDPWTDSLKLAEVMPFQGDPMWRLRVNRGKRVAAMCTGVGAVRAASAVTTLLHDERWDVTESIWFLAGVAGVDPKAGSLGSAFFARYVIGGDITRYVDPREAPKTWPYAWASLGHSSNQTYRLNLSLVDKALRAATSAGALPDSAQIRNMRAPYSAYPKAVEAPAVHVGDELATMSFWVGEHAAEWARSWVAKWTDGEAVFTTSAMEDQGVLRSLEAGARNQLCRSPVESAVVLRTASDYVFPGANMTIDEFVHGVNPVGVKAAIDAIRIAGVAALNALL
ncbi:purine nucleoside permease [Pseudoscourfieldia marina]